MFLWFLLLVMLRDLALFLSLLHMCVLEDVESVDILLDGIVGGRQNRAQLASSEVERKDVLLCFWKLHSPQLAGSLPFVCADHLSELLLQSFQSLEAAIFILRLPRRIRSLLAAFQF